MYMFNPHQISPVTMGELLTAAEVFVDQRIQSNRIKPIFQMDEYWRKEVIKAMKSGDYKGHTTTLRSIIKDERNCMCALGVVGDLVTKMPKAPAAWEGNQLVWLNTKELDPDDSIHSRSITTLPAKMHALLGMDYWQVNDLAYISDGWLKMLIRSNIPVTPENSFLAVINYLERGNVN